MNPMIQPDLHPDADMLNGFVERIISDADRVRIVAHLAGCERCREIVYLARSCAEPEMAPAAAQREPRAGWFSGGFAKWRIALIPAVALASVGTIVLWVQLHTASNRMETARLAVEAVPPRTVMSPAASASGAQGAAAASPYVEGAPVAKPAGKTAHAERIPRREGPQAAAPALGIVTNDHFGVAPGTEAELEQRRATSSIHLDERSAALARSAPPPEPINPPATLSFTPPRTASLSQGEPMENSAQHAAGKGPVTPASAPSPSAPGNVFALQGESAPPAAGGPAQIAVPSRPMPEPAPQALTGVAMMRLAGRTKLPSGLKPVSSAVVLNRLVAIDPEGSVFFSQDAGKHWEAVPAQWSGKAVAVQGPPQNMHPLWSTVKSPPPVDLTASSEETPENSKPGESANAVPAPPAPAGGTVVRSADKATATTKAAAPPIPGLLFKLVTDRHKVWVSDDGKVWREQ